MSEQTPSKGQQTEIDRLREELSLMKTAGIIEVAVRNPSVFDYMRHWEGRTEKAEANLKLAVDELSDVVSVLSPLGGFQPTLDSIRAVLAAIKGGEQ